jgi:hypothetical protein
MQRCGGGRREFPSHLCLAAAGPGAGRRASRDLNNAGIRRLGLGRPAAAALRGWLRPVPNRAGPGLRAGRPGPARACGSMYAGIRRLGRPAAAAPGPAGLVAADGDRNAELSNAK